MRFLFHNAPTARAGMVHALHGSIAIVHVGFRILHIHSRLHGWPCSAMKGFTHNENECIHFAIQIECSPAFPVE